MKRCFEHRQRKKWRGLRFQEQDGKCYYCDQPMRDEEPWRSCTLDHKIPLANGGLDEWENTAAACKSCNKAKKDAGPEWRPQNQGATT